MNKTSLKESSVLPLRSFVTMIFLSAKKVVNRYPNIRFYKFVYGQTKKN